MVSDAAPSSTVDAPARDGDSARVVNGFLGGIAGVILSVVPLSPLLGGAIAGYLEGGRPKDGIAAGAIAGLVMLVPFALALSFLLFLLGIGGAPQMLGLMGLVVLIGSALYAVGLGVLGGYLGNYLETRR